MDGIPFFWGIIPSEMARASYEVILGDDVLKQIALWYFGRIKQSKEIGAEINVRRQDVKRLAEAGKALLDKEAPPG